MPDLSSEILKFSWGTAYEEADAAWVVLDSAHTADPLDTAVSEAFMEFLATCERLASAAIRQYNYADDKDRSKDEEFYDALLNAAQALRAECASIREGLSAGQGDLIESLINSIPEDRWIRPLVDMYRLFDIGVNSATITLYTAAFDPLWYALHGHLTVNSSWSVNDVDIPRDSFIPPGFVGFTMPVDAPHGSVLSEVSISLSMRPSSSTCWGIYKRAPEIFWKIGSGATFEEVSDVSQWEPNAGVLVELWRFNTLDTAFDQDDFARWDEHEPEFGFGEIIWSGEVDLPAVGDNADAANEVEEAWEYSAPFIGSSPLSVFARKEYFVKKRLHLPDEAISAAALRVDRRHFAYALVIRFIGGPRRTPNALGTGEVLPFNLSDAVGLTSVTPDSSFDFPIKIQPQYQPTTTTVSTMAEATSFSFGKFGKAIAVGTADPGPFVDGDTNWAHRAISTMYPPNVKFRGARIGWLTDRAGDKGWG